MRVSASLAMVGGNTLEWYEFALYGYLTAVMAPLFFPASNPWLSLVLMFATFAISFVMRPIGGLFLGALGDRVGRKPILILSVSAMSLLTLCIGLLPTYHSVGFAAPTMLVMIRLLQGLLISSEFTGATIFQIESNPLKHRGFFGSLIQSSTFLGTLLATVIIGITTLCLGESKMMTFGWRLPYLLAPIFGVVILLLRLGVGESDTNKQELSFSGALKTLFMNYSPQLVMGFFIPAAATAGVYFFIYEVTYVVHYVHASFLHAIMMVSVCYASIILMMPLFAHWADKMGHIEFSKKSLGALILFSVPIFWLLSRDNIWLIFSGLFLLGLCLAPYFSINTVIIAELFPQNIRFMSLAFILNFSIALFGATTPLISFYLLRITGNAMAPGMYFILLGIMSWIFILLYPRYQIGPVEAERLQG